MHSRKQRAAQLEEKPARKPAERLSGASSTDKPTHQPANGTSTLPPNPLEGAAGIFADDPTWPEVQEAIRQYRAELNAEFE